MSVTGLCQICGTEPTRDRCERCGALVCGDHYVAGVGLCTDCAGPGGGRRQ